MRRPARLTTANDASAGRPESARDLGRPSHRDRPDLTACDLDRPGSARRRCRFGVPTTLMSEGRGVGSLFGVQPMTTHLKSMANRRNAARSTGPRSAVGKVRSSINAIQHGLRARNRWCCPASGRRTGRPTARALSRLAPAVGLEMDEATRRQARALLHGPTIQPIRGCLMDRLVALLRGRDDDKGQRAREALVAIGPPAVPALLAACGPAAAAPPCRCAWPAPWPRSPPLSQSARVC